jgi:hypothetical protein
MPSWGNSITFSKFSGDSPWISSYESRGKHMSLEWRIYINDEYKYNPAKGVPDELEQTSMTLERYYSPLYFDCDVNRFWPLTSASFQSNDHHTNMTPKLMIRAAKHILSQAKTSNDVRIAAWLWSWADQDSENERITLHLSY